MLMYRLKSFLMALPLVFLLTGCPDDGDHGGGGGAEGSSGTIVYLADQNTIGVFELYLASSGAKLNPSLPAGRSVTSFALTPDKTAVVYMADQTTDDIFELYRVNIATPGVSVKLNGTVIPVGGDVSSFAITPDGTSVVYLADQSIDQVFELFQVLFSTPQASVRLNPIFPPSRTVTQFTVTPDNVRVVYIADQDTDNVNELYQVALFNPPSNNTKLNSPLVP